MVRQRVGNRCPPTNRRLALVAVTHTQQLADLLANAHYVLLDFDGPVCAMFAELPAHTIADELHHLAQAHGITITGPDQLSRDPLAVLQFAAHQAPHLVPQLDDALRAAELHAANTAAPTPGATAFLQACHDTGRPVAIVSNNSAEAIRAYLAHHRLSALITKTHGRELHRADRMKPDPFLITQALDDFAAPPSSAVFVGDSLSDIQAARTAGVPVIGYANKPPKLHRLAISDAVITSMQGLAQMTATLTPAAP